MNGVFQKSKAWGWAAFLLLAIPAAVRAQTYFTNGNFVYCANWPEITIPEYEGPWRYTATKYLGSSGVVTIPGMVNGYPVTKVGQQIFYSRESVPKKVTISESGWFWDREGAAFYGCTNLTNVVFPSSITNIGEMAFYGCTKLTNIALPLSGWCNVGSHACACSGLRHVEVPDGGLNVGEGAFSDCAALTEITVFPYVANPTYFSTNGVLCRYTNRTCLIQYPAGKPGAYSIPEGVVKVEPYAFSGCRNLSGIAIGDGVTNIGHYAFKGCAGLVEIEIPDSVTAMGNYAFESCVGLATARVGNGITTLYGTFSQCSNLVRAVMGSGVANIAYSVFRNCPRLTGAYFPGAAPMLSGTNWFDGATNATVYRLPGAAGWPEVPGLWAGRPTALWLPETKADESLGVRDGRFGFSVGWAGGQTIVVEAATNLADPVWVPVGTNALDGDSTYFSDAEWADRPGCFYRITMP